MASSRLNQRNVLAAVVMVLLLSSFLPSAGARRVSYVPYSILSVVMNPLTDLLGTLGGKLRRSSALPRVDLDVSLEEMRLRNDELLQENSALRHHLTEAARRLAEYEMLDEHAVRLGFNLEGLSRRSVRVAHSHHHRLILSQGSTRGMKQDLIVVNGPHLVGRITEVTAMSSTVRLITSPDNPSKALMVNIVAAPGDASRDNFEIPLQLTLDDEGRAFTAQITNRYPVQENDLAVMADRRWRSEAMGFFVGRVVKVEPDPTDALSFRRITVMPIIDLPFVDHVVALVPALE